MGDRPIRRAQIALSGEGLRSRVATAEKRALGNRPKPKAKTKPNTPNLIKPKKKFVDARQTKIAAAAAADRAAIVARNKKMSLRSK